MFKRRKVSLMLVFVLAVGVLFTFSACGDDDEVADGEVDGPTTITVGTWADESLGEAIELFNEEYPDIEVETQIADMDDHHDTLLTRIAADGEVPDVAYIEVDHIGRLAAQGGFEDLYEEPYNAREHRDKLVDYPFNQAENEDGQLMGMPTDVAPGTIFYRHDRLEEIGMDIDDINDFDDWIEAGEKFAESGDDRWLLADAALIYELVLNSGDYDRYFDEDGESLVTTDRFVEAFTMAQKVHEMGLDAQVEAWSDSWFEVLNEGQVLMQPKGAWLGGHLRDWIAPDTAGDWRVAEIPEGYEGSWGGSFAAIPEASENKEAAWKFIEFMATNEELQWQNFEIADMYPTIESLYDREEFSEPVDFFGGQQVREIWADTLSDIDGMRTTQHDTLAEDVLASALSDVIEDGRDPLEALQEADDMILRRTNR